MRKQHVIVLAAAATLVGAAVFGLSRRGGSRPTVQGVLNQEDVLQIQRAVRRGRWQMAKLLVGKGEFRMFFGTSIPELTLGRVLEVGSVDPFPPGTTRAYAFSVGWHATKTNVYHLELTSSGWRVKSFSQYP